MPAYAWTCHSCKASNLSGTEACSACGFPAVANGAAIQEAVTGVKRKPWPGRSEIQENRRAEFSRLSLWKKPAGYALRLVQGVGAVILWISLFDLSWQGMLFGIGVSVVGEVLFQLLKGRPYSWEDDK